MQASLSQTAYEQIREKVITGELAPGTRLVNRTIGKQLGFSAIPVREALHRLSSEGLVVHIPGAGAFVRQMNRKEVVQLYEIREALECLAAKSAAQRINSYQLDRLNRLCNDFLTLANEIRTMPSKCASEDQLQRWLEIDMTYHMAIYEAADNPWLSKIVQDMRLMARVVSSKPHELPLAVCANTYLTHSRLVKALKKGDGDLASELMRYQIRRGLDFVMELFDMQ